MADLEKITLYGVLYEIYHQDNWPFNSLSDSRFLYAAEQGQKGKRLHIKRTPERVLWLVQA